MKKNFIFILIFILIFLSSCATEIVRRSRWEGKIDGNFGEEEAFKNKHDLELYFNNDNTCRAVIIINWIDGSSSDIALSGDYTLDNNNYYFSAEIADDDGSIEAEIEGTLNTNSSYGEGDIEFKYWGGPPPSKKSDWELSKSY